MIGFQSEDFMKLSQYLSQNFDFICEDHCISELSCYDINLGSLILSLEEHDRSFKVDKVLSYYGDDGCIFNGFDSGDRMILGNTFLQEHYTVIDIDHSKIGLGALKQFEDEDDEAVTPT